MTSYDLVRYCAVCGYEPKELPWGPFGDDPSYAICPNCNVEWGSEDIDPEGVRRFRDKWIADGAPWSRKRTPSDGLTVAERLERIGVALN